jgi:hypothetical protein
MTSGRLAPQRRGRLVLATAVVVALFLAGAHAPSHALPAGRAWSAVDSLGNSFTAVRIGVGAAGVPWLAAVEFADPVGHVGGWAELAWTGERFLPVARLANSGAQTAPEPCVQVDTTRRTLWLDYHQDENGAGRILLAQLGARGFSRPDTVMEAWLQSSETAGAFGIARAWIARCEQRFPRTTTYGLRVRSIERRAAHPVWRELPELGVNEFMCSIAPLPGDEAMVVYAGESGLAWARAHAAAWVDSGRIDARPWRAAHPRLSLDSDGGLWLLWTEKTWVHISRYHNGHWERGDSLRAEHPPGETYWASWCDLSREGGQRPVLAWGDRGFGMTHEDLLCVATPRDSGWSPGEVVPGTEGGFIPTVARDRNGDVWLAWSDPDSVGAFVVHTYTSVVADTPRLTRRGSSDHLAWQLSGVAPGSRWSVDRADGTGPFSVVGRLVAGDAVDMEWSGPAGRGPVRYRIRRDSIDARYAWMSPEISR